MIKLTSFMTNYDYKKLKTSLNKNKTLALHSSIKLKKINTHNSAVSFLAPEKLVKNH